VIEADGIGDRHQNDLAGDLAFRVSLQQQRQQL
jgi:hypothetical protein